MKATKKTIPARKRNLLLLIPFCLGLAALCAVALFHTAVPDPVPAIRSWPVSPMLLDREGNLVNARLSRDSEWCVPVPLAEMGPWLPRVLVAVEDKRFYRHPGVDVPALARAAYQNLAAGRVVSGASTITSQLIRLSRPRERTFWVKMLEFAGALKAERSMTKDEILEHYLNRAPLGGPIRGVEAAARLYFNKRARDLSLGEASLLVGLLKGPTLYRPDRNPVAATARRNQIIRMAARQANLPPDLTDLALAEPLPVFRPHMPDKARHFADLAFKTLPPTGGIVQSGMDSGVQSLLEQTLADGLKKMPPEVTASAMVVENATGVILAYVGNARYNGARGWVDCALAPRSPGSALKPFVYLEAMEQGLIIPSTLLADTALRLGGLAPRNFDLRYRGPVPARTALADSLNAPAVRVLRMVGVKRALERLRTAGFSSLNRDMEDYGDSLVLGAGEVTLLELARAYAGLATLGLDRPLLLRLPMRRVSASEPTPSAVSGSVNALPSGLAGTTDQITASQTGLLPRSRRLYSRAASFLIADILKDPGRLPFLAQLVQARENTPMAFKTGTSYGLRDAWTAAYNPHYTVAVWFGREDGEADPRLTGISLAAPAALSVLRSLGAGNGAQDTWFEPPPEVEGAAVCSLSGRALSPFCPVTATAWIIRDVWRTEPCPMHARRQGRLTVVWPPEMEDFSRKRFAGEDLARPANIVSPLPGAKYLLTPGNKRQPVPLKAEGVAYPVHWYAGGQYLGVQEREDLPLHWPLPPGRHMISLLDAQERISSAEVQVIHLDALKEMREEPLLLGE